MSKLRVHNLKTRPQYFKDIVRGVKKFEVRNNDRKFKVGDLMVLEEYDSAGIGYTGKFINTEITYVLDDPEYCKQGYVVLGFKKRLDRGAVL